MKVSAAVSKVSGAPAVSAAPVMVTKAEMIKEALGMPGPSTAAVVPAGCQSAFAIASSSPDFTILTQAIKATGLTSLLDNPALVATVFAPTDAAFTSTLDSLDITPQEVSQSRTATAVGLQVPMPSCALNNHPSTVMGGKQLMLTVNVIFVTQLFDDVVTLTAILKYHVIPGLSLSQGDFRDGQTYPTLLSGKQGPYTVEYASRTVYSLENAKDDPGNFESELAAIVPSGGKPAKITEFDVNAGCPSVINVIDRVLIPE